MTEIFRLRKRDCRWARGFRVISRHMAGRKQGSFRFFRVPLAQPTRVRLGGRGRPSPNQPNCCLLGTFVHGYVMASTVPVDFHQGFTVRLAGSCFDGFLRTLDWAMINFGDYVTHLQSRFSRS
jgi:hypothetical protein